MLTQAYAHQGFACFLVLSIWRYFARGGTNLVYSIQSIGYLSTQAASVLRFCLRFPFLLNLLILLIFFFIPFIFLIFLILLILFIFLIFLILLIFLIFLLLFCLLLSRGFRPRMHIKLPWGHLSVVGGFAEGN